MLLAMATGPDAERQEQYSTAGTCGFMQPNIVPEDTVGLSNLPQTTDLDRGRDVSSDENWIIRGPYTTSVSEEQMETPEASSYVDSAAGEPVRDCVDAATAARVYDAWLLGKDNRAVDRRVAEAVAELVPWVPVGVRANRRFLVRVVRHLAERGVRQFLDVGSGLPTHPNVHEVAQRVHPDARVVYVDNDPVVAAHGRALLAVDERTVMVTADATDPMGIVRDPEVAAHLDWSQPVGVLLVAVLHFVPDDAVAADVMRTFGQILVPGSAMAVSHVTPGPPEQAEAMREALKIYRELAVPIVSSTPQMVEGVP